MDKLKQVANWLWYPWLAALFPIVFLYANNVGLVYRGEVLMACGVAVVAVGLLVGLFWLIVRDIHKSGAMVLAIVIPFFSYGPLLNLLTSNQPEKADTLLPAPLLPVMAAATVLVVIALGVWVPARRFRAATPNLNLLAAGLVAFNLATVISGEVQLAQAEQVYREKPDSKVLAPKVNNDSQHPDVYYIILDAYPSNSSLMKESKIDNSAFTNELEKRGFYVAYDSRSNYPVTMDSLMSTLNMRYLEQQEGPSAKPGIEYGRIHVANNAVATDFMSRGYTYIFALSGFDLPSTTADLNIDHYADGMHYFPSSGPLPDTNFVDSFWPYLVDSTALTEADLDLTPLTPQRDVPTDYRDPGRVLALLDEGPRIARMPEATFAFLHLIMPHYPIRFDGNGQVFGDQRERLAAKKDNHHQAWLDQLNWFNGRMLQMVDEIKSNSSVPPIIIIQGDHGSLEGNSHPGNDSRFFDILNAYDFPGPNGKDHLTQDITPINTFAVLFNTYFGTNYKMQENRYFRTPSNYLNLFNFEETKSP